MAINESQNKQRTECYVNLDDLRWYAGLLARLLARTRAQSCRDVGLIPHFYEEFVQRKYVHMCTAQLSACGSDVPSSDPAAHWPLGTL